MLPPAPESIEAAKAANLAYVSDDMPGIRRLRSGRGFVYLKADGKRLRAPEQLERIRELAIPPAWTDVWICPNPRGHLQATGRDARGRKQPRYHPRWREVRDADKYEHMIDFGAALPRLRARLRRDMRLPGLPRQKVLAAVVALLERTLIRVGNEEYAKQNGSVGLTTMKNRHVEVSGSELSFRFRGKAGIIHEVDIDHPRLARIVRKCQDLPGQELFQYVGADGRPHAVSSTEVNEYLHEAMGQEFTAKDFRTWFATVLGARALRACGAFSCETEAKRKVKEAIAAVAKRLGNTSAICRKCYVHPALVATYMDGTFDAKLARGLARIDLVAKGGLKQEEKAVLAFLRACNRRTTGRSVPGRRASA